MRVSRSVRLVYNSCLVTEKNKCNHLLRTETFILHDIKQMGYGHLQIKSRM